MYIECQKINKSISFKCLSTGSNPISCRDTGNTYSSRLWRPDVQTEFRNWVDPNGPNAIQIKGNWNTSFGSPNIKNYFDFCDSRTNDWITICELKTLHSPQNLTCSCTFEGFYQNEILTFDVMQVWPNEQSITNTITPASHSTTQFDENIASSIQKSNNHLIWIIFLIFALLVLGIFLAYKFNDRIKKCIRKTFSRSDTGNLIEFRS